jgi:murein DD-endopeptidase MepM/ murein hydrolase activator NlpD
MSFSEGIIKKSLYSSAIKNNVDPNIIVEFASLYGFEIDFQRDIRKNDAFQILYETFTDEDGEWYSNGKIIYAYITVRNRELALYRYETDKLSGYFDINGKSVEKALMKTPINGARLSSPFGVRKHPILGFNKKHLGTDFAAPSGTPIMASGSGTIVKAQWCGGGGNCIKIKHNSTYSTIYAHLLKFASGIKSKTKVKQGQIIGYVGSTGLSTGPHLHYEVIVNGKKINSQKLSLPSGKILKGEDRKKFEIERIKTDVLLAETIAKKN